MRRIPVAGPWITDKEVAYVTRAVQEAWYDHASDPVAAFESAFADYVGRRFAISLPSCTSAIHLALASAGIGPGDEVIVPDLTWIATAAPATYLGARTVMADVDPRSLCLTPAAVEACLTPSTRAIIAVDLYGEMPDLEQLERLAAEHDLVLIEDAAEAIGSRRGGRPAGAFGWASVFSFHGSKTMTTGEGGMLVTDDEALVERAGVLRDHGRRPGDRAFNNSEVAFKYKMSGLQAALGLAQLERIEELAERKREIHRGYAQHLGDAAGVSLLTSENPGTVWWMSTLVIDEYTGWDKDTLQDALAQVGVDTRPGFRPLSSLDAYAGTEEAVLAGERNVAAYGISHRLLNLPTALSLQEEDVVLVIELLRGVLAGGAPR